jgi:hypothetical protein
MRTWNRWALTSLSRHVFVRIITCILKNLAKFDPFFFFFFFFSSFVKTLVNTQASVLEYLFIYLPTNLTF